MIKRVYYFLFSGRFFSIIKYCITKLVKQQITCPRFESAYAVIKAKNLSKNRKCIKKLGLTSSKLYLCYVKLLSPLHCTIFKHPKSCIARVVRKPCASDEISDHPPPPPPTPPTHPSHPLTNQLTGGNQRVLSPLSLSTIHIF